MKKQLAILLVLTTFIGKSQNFEYQGLFEGIGDNREYFNNYGFPQTILATRTAFEAGVKSNNHKIRGGFSYLFEFGSDIDAQKPKLTLYYQFSDQQTEFLFGAFPRRDKIDFPLAMLTDTFLYYRPNIEGMFGELQWEWGRQNGFIDWISRQTDYNSEIFTAGTSGEIFVKNFFLQNYILMTHDAVPIIRTPNTHIEDYLGFALQAGIRTTQNTEFEGYVKAGILGSSFRQRSVTDGYLSALSLFAEAKGKYKNFGIKSVLSSGASHKFAYGDLFYRAKNYLRTDAIWYFINHEKVKGTFNFSFHIIDWEELNNQQQLSIIYVFGK
ncbi:MAG: hypothetical protein FD181_3412 [Prolixibacteraceae bacterium]|nr:MAG: hypothetical protein FD181_3412 [Prolixibacteraceae bacterium]